MLMEMSDVKLKQKQLIVWTMDSIANNTTKKESLSTGLLWGERQTFKRSFLFFRFSICVCLYLPIAATIPYTIQRMLAAVIYVIMLSCCL